MNHGLQNPCYFGGFRLQLAWFLSYLLVLWCSFVFLFPPSVLDIPFLVTSCFMFTFDFPTLTVSTYALVPRESPFPIRPMCS